MGVGQRGRSLPISSEQSVSGLSIVRRYCHSPAFDSATQHFRLIGLEDHA